MFTLEINVILCNNICNMTMYIHVHDCRLNAVREVCVRCPLVMSQDLLSDLAGYKTYRDKGVVMAAMSLIQLYRSVRPELLQRKDRVLVVHDASSMYVYYNCFYSGTTNEGLCTKSNTIWRVGC